MGGEEDPGAGEKKGLRFGVQLEQDEVAQEVERGTGGGWRGHEGTGGAGNWSIQLNDIVLEWDQGDRDRADRASTNLNEDSSNTDSANMVSKEDQVSWYEDTTIEGDTRMMEDDGCDDTDIIRNGRYDMFSFHYILMLDVDDPTVLDYLVEAMESELSMNENTVTLMGHVLCVG